MTQKELAEYNMNYLNLNRRQYHVYSSLMKAKMRLFPKTLIRLIQARSREYGFCGEIISESTAEWVRKKIR